jgi:SAM-dependent methyltransferase
MPDMEAFALSLFYTFAYQLGFTPWENAATHAPAAAQISGLFDHEEAGREPPFGSALDLGCGTGRWAVDLAQRGWQVTAIDCVAKAVRTARQRAGQAGVVVRFIEGDVTALRAAGVGTGFRLFWDFGTLHGLTGPQLQSAGREISAAAAPDATVLMMAWAPGRRGPLPRGISRAEIETALPGWRIDDDGMFDTSGLPRPLRAVGPHWYRLRRA